MPRGVYKRLGLSELQMNHVKKIGFKKGFTPWNKNVKGYTTSKRGMKLSDAQKVNLYRHPKGKPAWNKGIKSKPHTEEWKKNVSEKLKGEKNWNWKGGKEHAQARRPSYELNRKQKMAGRPRPEECELCGRAGRICFDHDHITGDFRGWICHPCNATLGFVNDNPKLLEKLAEYLRSDKRNHTIKLQ